MAHFEVSGHSDRQTASPPTNAGTGFTGFLSLLLQKFPSNSFNGIAGLLDGWLDDVFRGGAVGPVRKSEWISCWRASSSSFWLLLTVPKKRQTANRSRAQKEGKSALQPFCRPGNVYVHSQTAQFCCRLCRGCGWNSRLFSTSCTIQQPQHLRVAGKTKDTFTRRQRRDDDDGYGCGTH